MSGQNAHLLLGIDVGGTFTDVVVRDERSGSLLVDKVPSTPHDQSVGVIDAIRRLRDVHGIELADLRMFAHGSTVATNALLELKLPRTALLVTNGFRDVLEIGTQMRPGMFDLTRPKQPPLVPRELVFEVDERVDRLGRVVRELTDAEIERVVDRVAAAEVESCAVSLIFAFRNGDHERRLADALRERMPGITVAVSSEVAPESREYPRTSTTAIAASVQPLVARYIAGIREGMRDQGVESPLFIMQSSGGVLSASEASRHSHRMLLSGPAAGVLGATGLVDTIGTGNQITFDMGGTSTDICLIHEGRATLAREPEFDGRPLRVPQLDIHTIGAGGGSLAKVVAGLLHVGPESAGAQPGPACYGRGGTRPTVTDAHVVLGRIDPKTFLGGEMRLDVNAARGAVQEHVAEPLGLALEEAALGILDIADAQMARGVRVVSVNRGFDPREFSLVAYGGAGPMHAASVGALVEVGSVVVPRTPGAFSALGLVNADVKYDLIRVVERPVAELDGEVVEALYEPLLDDARARLDALGAGVAPRFVRVGRFRYTWQENDVEVVIGSDRVTDEAFTRAVARFHELHDFEFGYSSPEDAVELIAVSLEAYGVLPRSIRAESAVSTQGRPGSAKREIYFRSIGWVDSTVADRGSLAVGSTLTGPAVIEEREATTVVPPGFQVLVDAHLNLVVTESQT